MEWCYLPTSSILVLMQVEDGDAMLEAWEYIRGYNGLYKISNFGKVFSCRSKRLLKPQLDRYGYYVVNLCKHGEKKKLYIHRAVAMNFVPNIYLEKTDVNHIDGVKTNNRADNLEWCTKSYNQWHSYHVLGHHNFKLNK